MNPFDELDHRLSVVKRWGILHTIQTQSVAEHVHNVVRITARIGASWFDLDTEELLTAILWAHHHDDEEALTGDLPTMVKPYFEEANFAEDHSDLLQTTMLPPRRITDIVKLADLLEGFHFIATERKLGNHFVDAHFSNYHDEIYQFIVKSTLPNEVWKGRVVGMMAHIATYTSTRHSRRGR